MTRTGMLATLTGATHLPRIVDHDVCPRCRRQQCVSVCPTSCFSPREDGRITLRLEDCVACRACVSICFEFTNIAWVLKAPLAGG